MSKEQSPQVVKRVNVVPLYRLLIRLGLAKVYRRFLLLTDGPKDATCLLLVMANLHEVFKARPFWRRITPFRGLPVLAKALLDNAPMLLEKVGSHLWPEEKRSKDNDGLERIVHPMHRQILAHPLYAMLCNNQESEALRLMYTALHLQILHARWREACKKGRGKKMKPIEVLKKTADPGRLLKLPYPWALTARHLSNRDCGELIKYLGPDRRPNKFRRFLLKNQDRPLGENFETSYATIRHCCIESKGAVLGKLGGGGSRGTRCPKQREFIDYGRDRLGVWLQRNEEGQSTGAIVYEKNPNIQLPLDEAAFWLGLDLMELVGGDATVDAKVPSARNPQEAGAVSRSATRALEIDRNHFPWAKENLCLEQFRRGILPALIDAADNPNISKEDLLAATMVIASIDSSRPIEHVIHLEAGRAADSEFAYRFAASPAEPGSWYWTALQPDYKRPFLVPEEMEHPRAKYLGFNASPLATRLIRKYCLRAKIPDGRVFRAKEDLVKLARGWVKRHDASGQATLANLQHLRWRILDRLTGGEKAIVCLVLGQPETYASTERHYAILGVMEASRLWAESSRILWSPTHCAPEAFITSKDIEHDKIIGIRAFPRLSTVHRVITELLENSKKFFEIRVEDFDAKLHGALLNDAVMYLVWHQMFAFATRAIVDAYQGVNQFAAGSGLGKLSDKDFEDHHKTRLVWASEVLLRHMAWMEGRLREIYINLQGSEPGEGLDAWFIDPESGKIIPITPSSIVDQLGARFPFEPNIPRKIMRHLLRAAGVSHDRAEVFMGHWWHGREPWSPVSGFDWPGYLGELRGLLPGLLADIGFNWIPDGRAA